MEPQTSQEYLGWCSWCLMKVPQSMVETSMFSRNIHCCQNCKKATLPCENIKRCNGYSKGWGSALMNENQCGLCSGRFKSWEKAFASPIAKKFLKWGYCSWCFQDCRLSILRTYPAAMILARDTYQCQLCSKQSVVCRNSATSNCQGFAREHESYTEELCWKCAGHVQTWSMRIPSKLNGKRELNIKRHCSKCAFSTKHSAAQMNSMLPNIYICSNCNVESVVCSNCEEGMVEQSAALGGVCMRCQTKPETSDTSQTMVPSKEWWKLILDVTDQNRNLSEQSTSELKSQLEKELLKTMKGAGASCMYSRGQILLKEGDVNTAIFLIESGQCEVSVLQGAVKTTNGWEGGIPAVVATLSTDDIVGEISFILGCQASATVTVTSDFALIRKLEMQQCEAALKIGGFKAKDLLQQIAFKLAGKLVISNNAKLDKLKLQRERQHRASQFQLGQTHEEDSEPEIDQTHSAATIRLSAYKNMFEKYDKGLKGSVSTSDCSLILNDCGIDCASDLLEILIDRYDADGSGKIEFDEFLRMIEGISAKDAQERETALKERNFRTSFGVPESENLLMIEKVMFQIRGFVHLCGNAYLTTSMLCLEGTLFGVKTQFCIHYNLLKSKCESFDADTNTTRIGLKLPEVSYIDISFAEFDDYDIFMELLASLIEEKLSWNIPNSSFPVFLVSQQKPDESKLEVPPTIDASMMTMLKKIKILVCTKGDILLEEGSASRRIIQILSGTAQIVKGTELDRSILFEVQAGAVLGELSFVQGILASASVEVTSTVLYAAEISHSSMSAALSQNEVFAARFYKLLAETLARRIIASN